MEQLSRKKKVILAALFALIAIGLGVWGGMLIAQGQSDKMVAAGEQISTTIAIVNMDDGIQYNGQNVNYASAFIASMGNDITVVSAQAAAQGLQNGTYGGVITIPADMSSKIVSINAQNPTQVVLTYEINGQLPQDKYIEVYQRISEAQQSLSSSLSYVFAVSIFEDIHESQENVDDVKANDDADLAAVNKMRLTNFMAGLIVADVPEVKPAYNTYDDTGLILTAGDTLAQDIDKLYDAEYQKMQSAYDTSVIDIGDAQSDIADWQTDQETYLANLDIELAYYRGQLDAYRSTMNTYYSDLINYKSDVDTYYDDVDAYKTQLDTYYNDLQTYQQALDDYKDDLENGTWLEPALDSYRDEVKTTIDGWRASCSCGGTGVGCGDCCLCGIDLDAELPDVSTYISTISVPEYTGFKATPPTLDVPSVGSLSDPGAVPAEQSDVQTGADNLDTTINGRPNINDLTTHFNDLNSAVSAYDPSIFFGNQLDTDVDNSIAAFGISVAALRNGLDSKQTENIQKLESAHAEYQRYVVKLRSDVLAKYSEDGKHLADALNAFYNQKLATSSENAELFSSIAGMLPYSWNNGAVNQSVTEFLVDPLVAEQKPYTGETANGPNTKVWQTAILIIVVVLALTALFVRFVKRKERTYSRYDY